MIETGPGTTGWRCSSSAPSAGTSVGLAYSLIGERRRARDCIIPSNGARAGGIVFPVRQGAVRGFRFRPGPSASRLGAFLILAVFHCDMVVSAMFFTGQASNPLIAQLARQVTGIEIGYGRWAAGALLPAVLSLAAMPVLLLWVMPPTIRPYPRRDPDGSGRAGATGSGDTR